MTLVGHKSKMGDHTLDPTHYILKFFRAGGVHPDVKVTPFLVFFFWMNCTIVSVVIIFATIGAIFGALDNDINTVVECLQSTFIYIHILGKHFVLFYSKPILSHLLTQRTHFLKLETFDPTIRQQYQRLLKKTSKFVNTFMFLTCCVVFSFYMQPYLTHGDLPVSVYVPDGWYYYFHFGFWPLAPCIVASIYGTDALFCAISVPIIVQFRLLARKIQNWKIENTKISDQKSRKTFKKNLKELVDHQNFLFEYCNEMNRFNNGIFLNQFLLSVGIICVQLYVVSQKGFKLPNKIKCFGYCFMEIIETAIYCFNAELISDASEDVGNAAYDSLWYESDDPEVRHAITLIIARCQNRIVFSGFGFVWINLKTFTQIFKTALSFYSYLHNVVLN
ncbi:odorant receptor 85b-like [Tribolium madens]|uniref:odorant receptor 85b-like n=1 Tax=Tribolium madens TaxID=41895 RepID=UPI001CF750BB|nr:odorant receptor 85b-like [Tribolium madens]